MNINGIRSINEKPVKTSSIQSVQPVVMTPGLNREQRRQMKKERQKREREKQKIREQKFKELLDLAMSVPMICPDCKSHDIESIKEGTYHCKNCGSIHELEEMKADLSKFY